MHSPSLENPGKFESSIGLEVGQGTEGWLWLHPLPPTAKIYCAATVIGPSAQTSQKARKVK